MSSFKRYLSAATITAALVISQAASAHIQEFAWNGNGDGTVSFFGSSYHGNLVSALGSGLVIDGTSFNYTSFTAISDANWTTFLTTVADGFQFIENFSAVTGYGEFTLSAADILGLGWTPPSQTFTASVFSSGPEFIDVNGNGTTYINTLTLTAVPEPAAIALVGLGLVGFGFARRRQA